MDSSGRKPAAATNHGGGHAKSDQATRDHEARGTGAESRRDRNGPGGDSRQVVGTASAESARDGRVPGPVPADANRDRIASLIADVRRVAWELFNRAVIAHDCGTRLSLDEAEAMSIDQRILVGDLTAMYDAIVEAREALDIVRADVGTLVAGDPETLDRLAAVRAESEARGATRAKQDAAARDRSGTERQRSRITRRASPTSHG